MGILDFKRVPDKALPERLSEGELNATIASAIETESTSPAGTIATAIQDAIDATPAQAVISPLSSVETPSEILARFLDYKGSGFIRGAIAGDSVVNDGGDPPRKILQRLGELTPTGVGMTDKQWSTSTNAYGSNIVVKAATATPSTGGTVLTDNFNRTAAELVGSTTSAGQVWGGTAGSWSANGTVATPAGVGSLSFNAASKDVTLTAAISLVTTNTGAQTILQVCASSTAASLGDNMVFAQLAVSTTGIPNFSVYKRIGGVNTQISSTNYSTGLTTNTATAQTATVKLQIAIQQVTATITVNGTDTVISGTIAEGDVPLIGMMSGVKAGAPDGRIKLDNFIIDTPFTPGTTNGVEFWNAAVPGTSIDYQTARVATMYPAGTTFDFLFMCGGHNNGTQTAEDFIADVDEFVTAFRAIHPNTPIIISSENPQFAPSLTIVAHARRQAALRAYAMENGHEYLPAFEAFSNEANGGVGYVQSDGIHPTVSVPTISLNWSGATLWAAVWLNIINARRRVGTVAPITGLP